MNIRKSKISWLVLLVIVLVGVRATLPYFITQKVNKTLDRIPEYDGRIEDVDLHLWRGAYSIDNIKLVKTNGKIATPFFECEKADFSVEWRALFDGSIVGELQIIRPKLNFVVGQTEAASQKGADRTWQEVVKELHPLKINKFSIRDGQIHYKDVAADPKVDVSLDQVYLVGTNFTNSEKISKSLAATIVADGRAEKQAPVALTLHMDPYEKKPKFNLDASIKGLDLARLNDFFRAYGNFDVEKGEFSLYAEVAAEENRFKGYLKPLLKDVHVFRLKTDNSNIFHAAWEGIVSLAFELFQNQGKDQVATRIPLSGSFDQPDIDLFRAVGSLLSNAFIKALVPQLENSVSLRDVDGKEPKESKDDEE